ncbi:ABC transporter permease [Kineosporia sp. NBRC 101677]|uniref:DMT family transporter n=1 Tax=Kineosporia sp. NBRC 101677 TaxID=3032197 RepID=UPI0024A181B3|nr:DMT family transporter [Kineosporia sp. NBRC 101677]GLY15640.1 ABC transporter permease [Kineosporia sp. NBRC 101677]
MEANVRWVALTAVAPIVFGSTYYVTSHTLPADHPFYGGALRALPAGLLLLLITRQLPKGSWWWRSLVLGALNFGAFFTLIYITAQLLPTSVASTTMATSSVMLMLLAWPLLAERPQVLAVAGAVVGIAGVAVMLLGNYGGEGIDYRGVLASLAAMILSSLGAILTKRWSPKINILALTSWQLIAGGLIILPVAIAVEGAPPAMTAERLAGYGYVTFVATALGFTLWFNGLKRLDAATVGLIGLLNPVSGVVLGVLLASEPFGVRQIVGVTLVVLGILLGQPIARRLLTGRRTAPAGTPSEPTSVETGAPAKRQ